MPWTSPAIAGVRLLSLEGDEHALDHHRDRTVVVHFFATWCEPCRGELTSLANLADAIPAGQLAILSIDVGEPEVRVRRFFETLSIPYPVLLDPSQATRKAWGVDVLPSTFVLGPGLCPVWRATGDIDWMAPSVLEKLRTLAANKPTAMTAETCVTKGERP